MPREVFYWPINRFYGGGIRRPIGPYLETIDPAKSYGPSRQRVKPFGMLAYWSKIGNYFTAGKGKGSAGKQNNPSPALPRYQHKIGKFFLCRHRGLGYPYDNAPNWDGHILTGHGGDRTRGLHSVQNW